MLPFEVSGEPDICTRVLLDVQGADSGAHPDEAELQSWIDKTILVLPEHSADAMDEARRLFDAIERAKGWKGTSELRQSLRYTLRHFPQEYEIRWKRGKGFGFDGWVGADELTLQVTNS